MADGAAEALAKILDLVRQIAEIDSRNLTVEERMGLMWPHVMEIESVAAAAVETSKEPGPVARVVPQDEHTGVNAIFGSMPDLPEPDATGGHAHTLITSPNLVDRLEAAEAIQRAKATEISTYAHALECLRRDGQGDIADLVESALSPYMRVAEVKSDEDLECPMTIAQENKELAGIVANVRHAFKPNPYRFELESLNDLVRAAMKGTEASRKNEG